MAGEYLPDRSQIDIFDRGVLNMTRLGLKFSGYINGVARKHRKVSRKMFPEYEIESITNGVHSRSWTAEPIKKLFEEYIPGWYEDPFSLRAALNIPEDKLWEAHLEAKKILFEKVKEKTGTELDLNKFTLGFARRFVEYKRPGMIFYDLDRFKSIAREKGAVQVIFSGKAHPEDHQGKELIKKIVQANQKINDQNMITV